MLLGYNVANILQYLVGGSCGEGKNVDFVKLHGKMTLYFLWRIIKLGFNQRGKWRYFDSVVDNIYIYLIYLHTCMCSVLYIHRN